MKKSINLLLIAGMMVTLGVASHTKVTNKHQDLGFSTQNVLDNIGGRRVQKAVAIGSENKVAKTFSQVGTNKDGNKVLRFATPVAGEIESIEYNITVQGYTGTIPTEVKTVYKGIQAGEEIKYFDGENITSEETYAGKYYWACYSITFGEDSEYKNASIKASASVTFADETSVTSAAKTVSLNSEMDVDTHNVTVNATASGSVTTDVSKAAVGQNVIIIIAPNDTVDVVGLKVNGTVINVSNLVNNGDGTYKYVAEMGESDLVVEGLFFNDETAASVVVADYEEGSLIAYQGESITLPSATASSNRGGDLTKYIEIVDETDPDAQISDGKVTSSVHGDHTITYCVKDVNNEVIGSKSITVTFARKLEIEWNDSTFSVQNSLAKDELQYVKSTNGGFGLCKMKFGYATDYYYEMTIKRATTDHYAIGLANYLQGSNEPLIFAFEGNDNNFKVKKFNTSGGGAWSLEDSTLDFLNYKLGTYRSTVTLDQSSQDYTMGVLRRGNVYYVFVNGGYAFQYQSTEYGTAPTTPGIFAYNPATGVTMHDIKYITGEELAAKEAELLDHGSKQIGAYTAGGYEWAESSLAEGNFTVNPYSEEKGINFTFNKNNTGYNDGMVSLYQQFEGDFTFEFDYKPTSIAAGDESFMWLELRYGTGYAEALEFGTKFGNNAATELSPSNVEQMSKNFDSSGKEIASGWANGGVVDFSEGFHYKLSRTIDGSNATYTLVVSSIATPSQVKTVTYTNTATMRILPLWHNRYCAGEYSHITWDFKA